MTNQTAYSVSLDRKLAAPIDRVFAALAEAEAIARWFGPSDDFKITVHQWDCRVGGKYRVEFNTPTGEVHIVVGEFKEITPNQRLAYTWSWEGQPPMDTLCTFNLRSAGTGTELSLVHEGFPAEEMRDHHNQGWTGSMDRLGRVVA